MNIQLSDHFTYKRLLRFTLPSIIMMIFTSIYNVVDGFFVSNYVGKTPFASVNFIMPLLMMLGAVGFMFGTGGSALVSKTMGEGKEEEANRLFSLFIYISVACGITLSVLGIIFIRPIAALLGADDVMLDNCVLYGRIILLSLPCFILQLEFQSFFVTAEKPQLGLIVTLSCGVTNIILDAILVAGFRLGLVGAAAATVTSECMGGLIPLIYFLRPNTGRLRLTRTVFNGRAILKACVNGSSELMSNISMSLVNMLYNVQLMKYAGEDGVAAYGVLMYVTLVFASAFIGFSIGSAPIIGFHYGAGNSGELKNLLRKGLSLILIFSLGMFTLAELLGMPLSLIFVGYDPDLYDLTRKGFMIYSFSFLFSGTAIFGSSFFTALNNGPVSAAISFLRTLVFQIIAVLALPLILGIDGIWVSIVAAEFMAATVTVLFLIGKRRTYHYG
ncbi:MAG: MATE family efflux transporter [Lachnospiraceae bacterium]|nr:MATE family efflux transporter [Lachnospiraceae bacterium]